MSKKNQNKIIRTYLHMVMHCVFQHQFVSPYIQRPLWNLACDIAVEKMIQELQIENNDKAMENRRKSALQYFEQNVRYMTAEKIYEYLTNHNLSEAKCEEMEKIFQEDNHDVWYEGAGGSVLTEKLLIKSVEKTAGKTACQTHPERQKILQKAKPSARCGRNFPSRFSWI